MQITYICDKIANGKNYERRFNMQRIKDLFVKYKEIISYVFFGVLTTVVSFVSYAIFTKIIRTQNEIAGVAVANVLSWVCAVIFAFVTNKLWVFESKESGIKTVLSELCKFTASRLFTGVIEWFGVPLLVFFGLNQTILGIEGMFSKVTVSVIVVILNYIFSKLFVFTKKNNE